ncbi:MAG: polyprenyl diphosphate synthase [Puniceicoccaceae bacterium]
MQSALLTPTHLQPHHIAIIMDGNGRWARQHSLPRLEGHRRGAQAVRKVVEALAQTAVRRLSLYAFSVENWQRPKDEISGLMALLVRSISAEIPYLIKNNIRLEFIGRTAELSSEVQESIQRAIEETSSLTGRTIAVALNYGSRSEILDAVNHYMIARDSGEAPSQLESWEDFEPFLYTGGTPDPDLVIRTSGEYRISNFLLLQSAYAEFVFTPVLWPDFSARELYLAIEEYARRERRFGKTGAQVNPRSLSQPPLESSQPSLAPLPHHHHV